VQINVIPSEKELYELKFEAKLGKFVTNQTVETS
jgi:hypothetical protein